MIISKENASNHRQFAIKIDYNYNTFNNYIIGKRKSIDVDLVCKVIVNFPDYSERWLLIGEGSKLKNISEIKKAEEPKEDTLLMKTVLELSGENALLKERVRTLEENKNTFGMAVEPRVKYSK